MNKSVLSLLASLTVLAAALLVSSASNANVIYDVTATYTGNAVYSFSMEFANATGIKYPSDLVTGLFENEQLSVGGVSYVIYASELSPLLKFDPSDPSAIYFVADTPFAEQVYPYDRVSTESNSQLASEQYGTLPISGTIDVKQRTVPEPETIALLGLGMVGLGATRRRSRSR